MKVSMLCKYGSCKEHEHVNRREEGGRRKRVLRTPTWGGGLFCFFSCFILFCFVLREMEEKKKRAFTGPTTNECIRGYCTTPEEP